MRVVCKLGIYPNYSSTYYALTTRSRVSHYSSGAAWFVPLSFCFALTESSFVDEVVESWLYQVILGGCRFFSASRVHVLSFLHSFSSFLQLSGVPLYIWDGVLRDVCRIENQECGIPQT